uniref:Uncharacterized protein n=1 Tax=Desertifilum tharense IPPAS B-1220 TaxID=1781255 RepID=A0ACD5GUK6_9CYAN
MKILTFLNNLSFPYSRLVTLERAGKKGVGNWELGVGEEGS